MKALVAYESRSGTTKRTAEAVSSALSAKGHEVITRPVGEVGQDDLVGVDVVFLGTWVEGFLVVGVGPAKAMRRWVSGLKGLPGTPTAVFCTYALNPRGTLATLSSLLEIAGARVVAAQGFNRRQPTKDLDSFVEKALAAASPSS